jgi:hypothetical protein
MPSIRAVFAEDFLVAYALPGENDQAVAALFEEVTKTVVGVIHLAQVAIDLWLDRSGVAISQANTPQR